MPPITHFLSSWSIADATGLPHRDRSLIVLCSILPDIDGIGVIVDLINRAIGNPESFWYHRFHHFLLHGLPGALIIAITIACFATRRLSVFIWGIVVVHFHLLCDLAGSRGPDVIDNWPIYYLEPLSGAWTIRWQYQWRLDSWPNIVFTIFLICYVLYRSAAAGRSPVSMVNKKANHIVAETLRQRWQWFKTLVSLSVK